MSTATKSAPSVTIPAATAAATPATAAPASASKSSLPKRAAFIAAVRAEGITGDTITRPQVKLVLSKNPGMKWPAWLTGDTAYRAGRGTFKIPA